MNVRVASSDDLNVSKDLYSTFRSLEEPARRGGEEGGVSGMLISPGREKFVKLVLVGVEGVGGELYILTVIEGLLDVLMLSTCSAPGR